LIASTAAERPVGRRWPSLARGPLRVGVALLLLFALVATLVGTRRLEGLDQALMLLAKQVTSRGLDVAVGVISYLAAAEVSLLLMLALGVWLWRRGLAANRAVAPLLFLVSLPIEIVLKFTLDQPVPSVGFYRKTIHYALLGLSTQQSFPSGHATRTAFMTVLASYLLVRVLGARRAWPAVLGLLALALAAGWSRLYLGYHWPMDVVGGFLLGGGMAALAISLLEPARALLAERERPYPDRSR
jgi:undecaprenyl-diphosphatase